MNISTASLLNLLATKINTVTTSSDDVKVNNSTNSADDKHQNKNHKTINKSNSIAILLNELFKNLSTGKQSKTEVLQIIKENKNSFNFKNLSLDLKIVIEHLEKNISQNETKVIKNINILKNSLIDLKNISSVNIKDKISNSGVFLESKLLKHSIPIKQDISELKQNITTLGNLKKEVVTYTTHNNTNNNTTKETNSKLIQNITEQKLPNTIEPKQKEIIKQNVNQILQSIKELKSVPKMQLDTKVIEIQSSIKNLDKTIVQNNITNDIVPNLKEVLKQAGTALLHRDIKINIQNIEQKLEQKAENTQNKQIQEEFKIVKQTIETKLSNSKATEEILQKVNNFESKLPASKSLFSNITANFQSNTTNNQPNIKAQNISNDLKVVIQDIQKEIESTSNSNTATKEIKATIDKIQSQIEFFQLLSFSQSSPQLPLSFLQDNIEDVDIKFNKNEKDEHSCQLNLSLKNYGELKVLLILDKNKNLNMNIGVENKELKLNIQQSLQKLRVALNSTGLLLQSLNVFDLEIKTNPQNGYSSQKPISFGLDITA